LPRLPLEFLNGTDRIPRYPLIERISPQPLMLTYVALERLDLFKQFTCSHLNL
jgi:hypothetical protein